MAVVQAFAERNGLQFDDAELLRTALTHRSYLNEHPEMDGDDNERLEYLGDAVLDFLLADALFRRYPTAREGELTALRAALVRRETLARLAERLGIGEALLMGHGEVETGGRTRAATLCAAFEALVGALYLDRGLAAVAAFVMPLMEQELSSARAEVADKDPKSRLQELAQGLLGVTPRYRTVKAEGPDHARIFTVEVYLGGAVCGVGEGHGKQVAAQRAAADALARQAEWAPPAGHPEPAADGS
ncbi:MAG: ribonuclease III [Anaerolineae bacterium]